MTNFTQRRSHATLVAIDRNGWSPCVGTRGHHRRNAHYIHNPENKFTLTVLGAVAELERAKIIERVTRAKQLRLAQGFLLGAGCNLYGYDYARKTPTSPAAFIINEKEAAVVREIFQIYAKGQVGMNQITRSLEDRHVPTKKGNKLWRTGILKSMLRNETYCGIRYFNKMKRIRQYANPLHDIKHTSSKYVKRPKDEWVGVKVPALVSRAVFDKVQERIAWNKQHYRNPRRLQLLSSLVRCGSCGGSFFSYRTWTVDKRRSTRRVYHTSAYKCNWRQRMNMHSKNSIVERCYNKQVSARILEARVFSMIEDVMLDSDKLKTCMDFFRDDTRAAHAQLETDLKTIDQRMHNVDDAKQRIIDVYASGDLPRDEYVKRSLAYDNEINQLKADRADVVSRIPLLHKANVVDLAIAQYCSVAKLRYENCNDFASKRRFLVDYITKVVFSNDRVEVHGSLPVQTSHADDDGEANSLSFCIEGRIARADWFASRRRSTANARPAATP